MERKTTKPKRCSNKDCPDPIFIPQRPLQKACSYKCALAVEKIKTAKRREKEKREFNAETRRMKEKIKTLTEYLNDAQKEFNKFIRLRDYGNVCISCQKPPKKKNAGHYRTTKAASQLRFNEDNCHLQCEHCNTHTNQEASPNTE